MHGFVLDATSFPADDRSVGWARKHAVRVYGGHPDVDSDLLDDVGLTVSEVVTNAVRHGSGGVVQLILHSPVDGELQMEVHDRSSRLPVRTTAEPEAENGRGLAIIDGLCTRWSVNQTYSGKSVSFTLRGKS